MKNTLILFYRIGTAAPIILLLLSIPFSVLAEEGCRTGAVALANAYVRLNPMYAYIYGDLESYIESNEEHFRAGGDSVRCARALSQALMKGALQSHDPKAAREAIQRKQALDTQLGLLGIAPGAGLGQPTVSDQLFGMSLQLARLARVLPPAANGDVQPLYTPTNEFEQLQLFATQLMKMLLQDPMVAQAFRQVKPMIEEAANAEFKLLVGMARSLDPRRP